MINCNCFTTNCMSNRATFSCVLQAEFRPTGTCLSAFHALFRAPRPNVYKILRYPNQFQWYCRCQIQSFTAHLFQTRVRPFFCLVVGNPIIYFLLPLSLAPLAFPKKDLVPGWPTDQSTINPSLACCRVHKMCMNLPPGRFLTLVHRYIILV